MSGIGHNGGPQINEHAAAIQAEIYRLRNKARDTAQAKVRNAIGGLLMATRFAPSRLRKCPRDREWLARHYEAAHAAELSLRLPQINRLQRKLKRMGER